MSKESVKNISFVGLCRLMKFQFGNSSPRKNSGEDWLLLYAVSRHGETIGNFVWVCLGRPSSYYGQFHSRFLKLCGSLAAVELTNLPLHKLRSNLCGLYCLYLVQYLVKKNLQDLLAESKSFVNANH